MEGLKVNLTRGFIGVFGPAVDAAAAEPKALVLVPEDARGPPPAAGTTHLTLIPKKGICGVTPSPDLTKALEDSLAGNLSSWKDLGLGRASNGDQVAYYKVVLWPQLYRVLFKLLNCSAVEALRDLHVTVGTKRGDVHDVSKGLETLLHPNRDLKISSWCLEQAKDAFGKDKELGPGGSKEAKKLERLICLRCLEAVKVTCPEDLSLKERRNLMWETNKLKCKVLGRLKEINESLMCAEEMIKEWPENAEGWSLVGDCFCELRKFDEALSSYRECLKLGGKCKAGLEVCRKYVLKKDLPKVIIPSDRVFYSLLQDDGVVSKVEMPRNYSWVVEGKVLGLSLPKRQSQIEVMEALGIGAIYTVLDEETLPKEWFIGRKIKNVEYPTPNYMPPSIEQVDAFIEDAVLVLKSGKGIAVHCGGGKGRAGTFLACLLIRKGFELADPEGTAVAMGPSEAISALRSLRPSSVETKQQEDFIAEYAGILWKRFDERYKDEEKKVEERKIPEIAPERKAKKVSSDRKELYKKSPRILMLVGLPGSGKSTLSSLLLESNLDFASYGLGDWVHVCQDDLGSIDACLSLIVSTLKKKKDRIIIDRCNVTVEERASILNSIREISPKAVIHAAFFDVDEKTCVGRVTNRESHATLGSSKKKDRADRIVASFAKTLVPPKESEGFAKVHWVKSSSDLLELYKLLGGDENASLPFEEDDSGHSPPWKFPRTKHIFNPGGTALGSDDILLDVTEQKQFYGREVLVQEKVDGANLGLSISKDWQILAQNRSHWVTSESGSQWSKLSSWIDLHRGVLAELLEPGRHILFGEWCTAKHSVPYDSLPDWFLAFDIYDSKEKVFWSFERLKAALESTSEPRIYTVPDFGRRVIKNEKEALELLELKSQVRAGSEKLEGVYLRIEDREKGILLDRCKLVRPDFIQGITEHWSRKEMEKNKIKF